MISIYKDMSDLDSTRISEVVDAIEKVFDEDRSGSVGQSNRSKNSTFVSSRLVSSRLDINEFMRGFILTTKGDLQAKIDYTFRIYDQNDDNQISGEEIENMANVSRTKKHVDRWKVYSFSFRRSFECWAETEQLMMKRRFW